MELISILLGTPQVSFGLSDREWLILSGVVALIIIMYIIANIMKKKREEKEALEKELHDQEEHIVENETRDE